MSVDKFLMVIREDACVNVQLVEGGPISIMKQKDLEKRTIVNDNDRETSFAVEYRVPGNDRVVHRSAHVQLKQGVEIGAAQGEFGG